MLAVAINIYTIILMLHTPSLVSFFFFILLPEIRKVLLLFEFNHSFEVWTLKLRRMKQLWARMDSFRFCLVLLEGLCTNSNSTTIESMRKRKKWREFVKTVVLRPWLSRTVVWTYNCTPRDSHHLCLSF